MDRSGRKEGERRGIRSWNERARSDTASRTPVARQRDTAAGLWRPSAAVCARTRCIRFVLSVPSGVCFMMDHGEEDSVSVHTHAN